MGLRARRQLVGAGRQEFVGREDQLAALQRELHLPPESGPRFIISISGVGGVGKSSLVREIMLREPRALYSRIDETDPHGDPLQVIRSLAHRFGRPLPQTEAAFSRLGALLARATSETGQLPPELFATSADGARGDPAALARRYQELAAIFRLAQDDEDRAVLEDPVGYLTRAFVRDLNALGADGRPVALVFDTYEVLGRTAGPWLLRDLLGRAEGEIACDLRLIVAGRERLQDTDPRWRNEWDRDILNVDLEPFSEAEAAAFLRLRCGIEDPAFIARICQLTDRLPLWLDLWRETYEQGRGDAGPMGAVGHIQSIADRIVAWWPDPKQRRWVERSALCRWFDQDVLTVLLGPAEAEAAFAWLTKQYSIARGEGERWTLHRMVRTVMTRHLAQRSVSELQRLYQALLEHFENRVGRVDLPPFQLEEQYATRAWTDALLDRTYYALLLAPTGAGQAYLAQRFAEALEYAPALLGRLAAIALEATEDLDASAYAFAQTLAALAEARAGERHAELARRLDELLAHPALTPGQRALVQRHRDEALRTAAAAPAPAEASLGPAGAPGAPERAADQRPPEPRPTADQPPVRSAPAEPEAGTPSPTRPGPRWGAPAVPAARGPTLLRRLFGGARPAQRPADARPTSPTDAAAYLQRGENARLHGDYDRAVAELTEAIRLDGSNPIAYAARGEVFRVKGMLEPALEDLTRAIKLDPSYAWAYSARGAVHRLKGQLDAAQKDYDRAIKLDPESAWAHALRGEAHKARGQLDAARRDLLRALELDPTLVWAEQLLKSLG